MRLPSELIRVLEADLGKNYDPARALEFLRTLTPENKKLPEAERLNRLLENPPDEDTTLQTIYETAFVRGDIVIAGKKTRKEHPLTSYYPMHFRKTYLQKFSRWETPPSHEEAMTRIVWKHFNEENKHQNVPLALGSGPTTFRSQLMEGKTLAAAAPVHKCAEAKETAAQVLQARKNFGPVTPFWRGLESVFAAAQTLWAGGILHGDLHDHNMLVSPAGDGFLIDFETSEEDDRFGTLAWEDAKREDMAQLVETAALTRLCACPPEKLPAETPLAKAAERALATSPKLLAIQTAVKQLEKPAAKTAPDSPGM